MIDKPLTYYVSLHVTHQRLKHNHVGVLHLHGSTSFVSSGDEVFCLFNQLRLNEKVVHNTCLRHGRHLCRTDCSVPGTVTLQISIPGYFQI